MEQHSRPSKRLRDMERSTYFQEYEGLCREVTVASAVEGVYFDKMHADMYFRDSLRWAVIPILKQVMIRHTKQDASVRTMELPPKVIREVSVKLTEAEMAMYKKFSARVKEEFATLQRQGRVGGAAS